MTKWHWNQDNMFFLTRTPVVEITTVGDPCDVDCDLTGTLYQFSDQCIKGIPIPDQWGRNHIDQQFIALCDKLYVMATCTKTVFHSLTTRKDGNRYLVRVQYDDVDLEMEVVEAFHYFTKLLEEQKR